MAKNQSTYTLKIDAELGNLQQVLSSAQQSLQSFMATGSAPKGLEKAFEKIRDLLGQIQDKTGAPLDIKGLTSTGKSLISVEESFRSIIRLLGEFDNLSDDLKLSFLTDDDKRKIESVTESLKKYQETLASVRAQEKQLEMARKTQERSSSGYEKAKKKIGDLTDKKTTVEAKRESKRGQLSAMEALGDKADPVQIAKIRGSIVELDVEVEQLTRSLEGANAELITAKNAFESSETEVARLGKSIQKTNGDALKVLKKEAEALGVSLEGLNGHNAAEQMKMLTARMAEFKGEVANGARPSFETIQEGCVKAAEATRQLSNETQEAVETTELMNEAVAEREAFEGKIKQFLGLQGAAKLMRAALRDALETITELDATMTEMAVVTDLTVGDYWNQLPEYSKQASELGVSINSAYKAATLYYQQGLKSNEVTKISAETLKLAKIAGLDAADATDKMTAALRGFNMELNEASAQKISDVYSQLAAITAADVDEISSAMTKTASIASSAGMEFETTAAFLSQIIETTRESAETAGTAMKTIVARFQELKKDPAEIGEVDGEIVNANQIEDALRSVGVALRDSSGQFRELDEVFLELSSKWDGLDKNTQRYIATIAAGSRQQSRFIAMMQNYGRTQELVAAANNSAGASQKQFEKTMDSLQAKVEKLKNAWHEFTMGIVNSDLVKIGVDIATKFLEILNKVTNGIEGLGGSVVKIMSVLGIFKLGMKIFQKFRQPLVKFFADVAVEAKKGGEEAVRAFDEGARKGVKKKKEPQLQEGYTRDKDGRIHRANGEFASEGEGIVEERIGLKKFGDQTIGLNSWQDASKSRKAMMAYRSNLKLSDKQKENWKQAIKDEKKKKQKQISSGTLNEKELKATKREIELLDTELKGLEMTSEDFKNEQQKMWNSIGSGVSKTGESLSSLGISISALGGLFSALGLEELGDDFATVGNWAMVAGVAITGLGKALSLIPPLLTAISAHPIIAGITIALAIITAIFLIIKKIKQADSTEAKLKKATKAIEETAKAADRAKEAYQGLNDAFESLAEKYKTLDGLTKGTKEWNKAILETNAEVLELIKNYPELAKYVSNIGGVLKIDLEGDQVQEVLNSYYERTFTTANASIQAKINQQKIADQTVKERLNLKEFVYERIVVDELKGSATTHKLESTGESVIAGGASDYKWLNNEQIDIFAKGIASGIDLDKTSDAFDTFLEELGISAEQFEILSERTSEQADSIKSYGEKLLEHEQIESSYYSSMANSILGLVDTLELSSQRVEQLYNFYDGKSYKESYDKTEKVIEKIEEERASGQDWNNQVRYTVEAEYGAGALEKALEEHGYIDATYNDDGTVTYSDNGKIVTSDISENTLKTIIRNYGAKHNFQEQADNFDYFMNSMRQNLSEESVSTLTAIEKALENDQGTSLTNADITALSKLTDSDIDNAFENLPDTLKEIYGDASKYKKEILSAKTLGAQSLDVSKIKLESLDIGEGKTLKTYGFMEAGQQKAYAEQMASIYSKSGGAENVVKVQDAFDTILEKTTRDAKMGQIISQTDWTNREQLLALQLELEKQFGLTESEAKTFVTTLGDAAYATSRLTTTLDIYGEFWQATEKINQSMKKLSELQWEYDRALESGEGNISDLTEKIISENQAQATFHKEAYTASNNDLARLYAQGGLNYKVDLRDAVTLGEYGVDVDQNRLQDYVSSGKITQEEADTFVDSLTKQYEISQEYLEGMKKNLENIEELEEQGKETYYELRDMVGETILDSIRKQIDLQQDTLDTTRDASSKVVSKIQEQIDDQRQARQNEEAEKNIAKLQSQQAYLAMDTSGINALAMVGLDQQIQQAEQDYQDSLIDQTIQSLSDANEKAAEQRERQINISEMQLEAYQNSAEFQAQMDTEMRDLLVAGNNWQNSTFGEVLFEQYTKGMSSTDATKWADSLSTKINQASTWYNTDWDNEKNGLKSDIDELKEGITNLPTNLATASNNLKLQDQKTRLQGSGFSKKGVENLAEDSLNKLDAFVSRQTSGSTSGTKTVLNNAGVDYDTEAEYIASLEKKYGIDKILNGEAENTSDFKTYDQYLTETKNNAKNQTIADAVNQAITAGSDNNHTGLTNFQNTDEYKIQKAKYESLGGTGFDTVLVEAFKNKATGHFPDGSGPIKMKKYNDNWMASKVKVGGVTTKNRVGIPINGKGSEDYGIAPEDITALSGGVPQDGWLAMYDGIPFIYNNGGWRRIENGHTVPEFNAGYAELVELMRIKLATYKTGGIADFTGPAWLDGTPSRPEYVLNAQQTERFFSLIDVLEGFDTKNEKSQKSGDNYFDININVEKLENDYDVEQVADKIRRMIYDDATYRNTNAINHIR